MYRLEYCRFSNLYLIVYLRFGYTMIMSSLHVISLHRIWLHKKEVPRIAFIHTGTDSVLGIT